MIDLSKWSIGIHAVPGIRLGLGDIVKVKYLPSNEVVDATFIRYTEPGFCILQAPEFAVAPDPDLWVILD